MYLGGNRRWVPLNQGHIFVNNWMARNMSCLERNDHYVQKPRKRPFTSQKIMISQCHLEPVRRLLMKTWIQANRKVKRYPSSTSLLLNSWNSSCHLWSCIYDVLEMLLFKAEDRLFLLLRKTWHFPPLSPKHQIKRSLPYKGFSVAVPFPAESCTADFIL